MFKYSKKLSYTIFFALLAFISFTLINTIVQAAGEAKQWGASGINITNDAAYQEYHFSVSDGSDGMYVAWDNSSSGGLAVGSQGVYIQRYNSSGTAVWGAPVKVYNNLAYLRGLEQDGSGGVVVAVTDGLTSTTSVKRLNNAGVTQWTTDAFNTSTNVSDRVYMEKDSSNNYFIVKEDRIQKLDSAGTRAWGVNGVDYNETVLTYSIYPQVITPLENGGVAISWITTAAGDESVYAQYINSAGTPLGTSIVVSAGVGLAEGLSATALADGTNFYVVYAVETGVGTNLYDLKVKKYDTSGTNLFAAGGVTIDTGINSFIQSSITEKALSAIIHDTADNSITFGASILKKMYRINTSGTVLWSASLDNIQFNEFTVGSAEPLSMAFSLTKNEIAFTADSGYTTFAPFLITFDYTTGARHTYNEVATIPGASNIARVVPLHVDTSGNYLTSWQYATAGSAPRPYDVFIQKLTPQNYGAFQITGLTGAEDVFFEQVSIKDGSPYGVNNSSVVLEVKEDGYLAAKLSSVNMTADRNWSSLDVDVDLGASKIFISGTGSLPGFTGPNYTLYVPTGGRDLLVICPNATNISQVAVGCSGRIILDDADAGVSVETINSIEYWVVENVNYAGGVSTDGYNITNLDAGLNVIDVATGDNLESGEYFGNYTVRVLNASNSKILAEFNILMTSNLDWSTLTFGSTGTETYLSGVTSLEGFVGSNYIIFVPRGGGDTNVYTCPTAANVSQVDPNCSSVNNLGVSATNLSQVTISANDYWRYANYTGTNLGREFVEVLLGDILIVYNDSLSSSNSGQHMYDLLDGLGYDVTLSGSEGVPTFETLDSYKAIIYTQGDGYNLDTPQVTILKEYLDNGKGRIFFEGEEYLYEAGDTDFAENYVRTLDNNEDAGNPGTLTVVDFTHPVTQGLAASTTHTASSTYSDGLDPVNGSQTLLSADFGGSPAPILLAYDNGLTCTESKKTVSYGAIWKNNTEGINDVTFRETLLVNIVDWLLDNPCTIDNLPVTYNLTAEINSSTVDLETTGAEGAVTGNLKTATNAPLADIGITLTDNFNWSTLNLDVDAVNSKIFSGNLLDMPGAGNEYTLYVPIAPAHASITQVSICVGAANLAAVTNTCTGIGTLTDGQTATISGQLLTANKQNIGGSDYWVISGFTAAAGALVTEPAAVEPEPEPEPEPTPTPTPIVSPTPGGQGSSAPTSFPVVTAPVSSPAGDDSDIPQEDEDISGGSIDDETEGTESGNIVSDIFNSVRSFIEDTLNITPEILTGAVLATALVTTAAVASGSVSSYSAYFLGALIWRRQKYWGLIYEVGSFAGLGLVTVRVYKNELGKLSFVNQTVSDFEGKYGLNISDPGEYTVEFIREGFKTVTKTLSITRGKDVILDIGMIRTNNEDLGIVAKVRYFWKENAPVIMQVLRFVVVILMVWGLSSALNALSHTVSIGNLLITGLYLTLILMQLWLIVIPYFGFKTGSIVDTTKKPLKGVILRLISMDTTGAGVENLGISNSNGVVKLRTNAGQYQFIARLLGYQTANGVTVINNSGKLSKTIELAKAEGASNEFGVL